MLARLYRSLLWLLPTDFRRDYGDEMCRVVREHWRAQRPLLSPWGALRFWARQGAAIVGAAISSRRRRRGALRVRLWRLTAIRGADSGVVMDGILQDVRYSLRGLLGRPAFAAITALTLALGIGASTAIFSAVHTVIFRELPYGDVDRIVAIFHVDTETGERGNGMSAANARDLIAAADLLTAAAVADPYSLDLQFEDRAESLRAWLVSEGFFAAARVSMHLGRAFTADEYVADSEAVVILGYRSWRSRFGADPEIVGRTLTLDGQPVTAVGVLPPEFKLPDEKELWLPRAAQPYDDNARAADYMMGIGRLAPGATIEQARAEAERIAASLGEAYPRTNSTTTFQLLPLREYLFGSVRTPLLVLMGAVGFVLLIACANVAGLMLARGTDRQREYAVRSALGAGAGRLTRQVTIDSVILAALGCVLGIGLAYVGIQVIRALGPDHLPRIEEIGIDRTVLVFAVAVAALSAVLSGLAPSLRFSRPDLRAALGERARGSSAGPGGVALRSGLVVTEVAAAMVLVVGAGLLTASFARLLDEDLGFDPTNRLVLQLFAYGYATDGEEGQTRAQFVDQVIDEMEAIPGIRQVALTSNVPGANDATLASIDIDLPFTIVDRAPPETGHEPEARISMVSHQYLDVMSIPLVGGRTFAESDDAQAPQVVLVNQTFVRRHFPDADPLGEKITIGFSQPTPREIVGVVADVRPSGYESQPRPWVYFPIKQQPTGSLTFVARADIDAALLTNAAREAIWRVNPQQSIWGAATLETLLGDWLKERSFNLMLLSSFALIALLLAGIGLYGLISFSVEQRVAEMGIRRALGGQSAAIVTMVLREAAGLAIAGVVIGIAGALALTRFIQGMLFEVAATDPPTLIALAAAVLAVAAVAALVPAMRAMRIDPIVALRTD